MGARVGTCKSGCLCCVDAYLRVLARVWVCVGACVARV